MKLNFPMGLYFNEDFVVCLAHKNMSSWAVDLETGQKLAEDILEYREEIERLRYGTGTMRSVPDSQKSTTQTAGGRGMKFLVIAFPSAFLAPDCMARFRTFEEAEKKYVEICKHYKDHKREHRKEPEIYAMTRVDPETYKFALEQRESEMKPDWRDAPNYARWLSQDSDGTWIWFENKPEPRTSHWAASGMWEVAAKEPAPWTLTRQQRPEVERNE